MKILITGASSGIGRALALTLLDADCEAIYVVARRLDLLEALAEQSSKIHPIQADIATPEGRSAIMEVCASVSLTHVVHNAAIAEPIAKLKDVQFEDFKYQMAVNVEGPFFLTQLLIPVVEEDCRFLFISSGAAFKPWQGIGSYSISKAALKMVCEVFKQEYAAEKLLFTSLRPGGVDTPMLRRACEQSSEVFPAKVLVVERSKSGDLLSAKEAAEFIRWVLLQSSSAEYENDWNIKDTNDSYREAEDFGRS